MIKCESGNRRHTSTTVSRDYLPESFLPSGSDEFFDSSTDARENEDVVPEALQDSSQVARSPSRVVPPRTYPSRIRRPPDHFEL